MAETEQCFPSHVPFLQASSQTHDNHVSWLGTFDFMMTIASQIAEAGAVEKHFRRNTESRFVETTIALPLIPVPGPSKTTLKVPLPLLSSEPKVTAFVINKSKRVSDLEMSRWMNNVRSSRSEAPAGKVGVKEGRCYRVETSILRGRQFHPDI